MIHAQIFVVSYNDTSQTAELVVEAVSVNLQHHSMPTNASSISRRVDH